MKNIITPSKWFLFTILIIFAFNLSGYSQPSWSKEFSYSKSFIENKGQFSTAPDKEPVLFAFDNGNSMIRFTKKGLIYSFVYRTPKMSAEEKREKKKNLKSFKEWREFEDEEKKMNVKTDIIYFKWLNANSNVEIIASEPTEDYHS